MIMPQENESSRILTCGAFSGVLEEVSCPICDPPPEPRLVFRMSNGVGIWLCPGCGIMYASPRFTEESLLQIYEEDAFIDSSFYDQWSYEKWKKENINRSYVSQELKVRLVRRFLQQNESILDVGCGTGLFCVEASRQGLNVEGIDPSKMLVELGRRTFNLPLHLGQLKEFDPGHRYKGIVIWAVLEHVYDLVDMVGECGRLLEEGGVTCLLMSPIMKVYQIALKLSCADSVSRRMTLNISGFPGMFTLSTKTAFVP